MTKRIRFVIFLAFLIMFLLAAPIAILYSLGYRFNPQQAKLVQIGGLFLKVVPSAADVYVSPVEIKKTKVIEGLIGQAKSFYEKTGFFQGSAFVQNLFPQKYAVKVEKPGFYPWEKSLEVSEGIVTEAKDIILIPADIRFEPLSENIQDFWFSPDKKYAVLETSARNLELFDVKRNTSSLLLKKEEMELEKNDYLDLFFSFDSEKALIEITKKGGQKIFYVLLIKEALPRLISLNFSGLNVKKTSFNPLNPDEVFFAKQFPEGDFVFSADYIKKTTSAEPILAGFLSYEVTEKEIIWLDNKGFLLKRVILNGETEYLNPEKTFIVDGEKKYQIISEDGNILIKENDVLFFFDKESKSLLEIFKNIKYFDFSPDFKKIALTNDNELWIIFGEEQEYQPYKNKFDKVFLTNFSARNNRLSWFSTQYLIFADEKIKISEIDDRDKINIVELAAPASPEGEAGAAKIEKIFFSPSDKKLYILSDTNFYSSGPLR